MGALVLIIGVMPRIIFPSILEEARSMAIDHLKDQGIDVEFDLQIVYHIHSYLSLVQRGTIKPGDPVDVCKYKRNNSGVSNL